MAIKITNLLFNLLDDVIQAEMERLFASYGAIEFRRPIEVGEDGDDKVSYIELDPKVRGEGAVKKVIKTKLVK